MLDLKENEILIRKFCISDVENKVKWINDSDNNKYLHYDLPLEYEKTVEWLNRTEHSENRIDGVIEYNGTPVGLIGLLNIDTKNKKAEYYICMGEKDFKGKGIAKIASKLLINYAFDELNLNKIYLYTEEKNILAQKLFERLGFEKEGFLREDLFYNKNKINRFVYGMLKKE